MEFEVYDKPKWTWYGSFLVNHTYSQGQVLAVEHVKVIVQLSY
jgi:hypothetical protein